MPVPAHLGKGALVSATQDSTESPRFVQPDEFIQHQLQRARSRIQSTDILSALVLSGLLLVGYVLIFTLLDHWVIEGGFQPFTRAIMLLAVLSGCGILVYRFVFRRMNSAVNPLFAAQMLEHGIASSRGSLLTLVDLQNSRHQPAASVRRTLANRAAAGLNQIHLDEVIYRSWLLRGSMALFVITLLICLYAVLSPKSISLLRPLSLAGVDVATRTRLESILPGNTTITAGTWLKFQTDLAGALPAEVQVLYTTADRRFVDEPLTLQASEDEYRFIAELTGADNRGIRQNLTYYVRAGDAISQTFSVTVIQPPSATLTRVHYRYPSYMQLSEHSSTDQAISTWEDAVVTLEATATVPLSSAVLQLSDDPQFSGKSEEIRCSIDDLNLRCEWKMSARSDGSFPRYCRIQVTDSEGAQNPAPPVYPVEVRRDQPPVVRLLDPAGDLDVPRNAIIPLLVEAEDPDFLLRNVTLHCTINGQPPLPTEFLMDAVTAGPLQKWSGIHELRIDLLRVQPGDVVTCYIEARDNHPPLGNASRSSEIRLQIQNNAAPEQVQEQLRQDREIQQNMMRSQEHSAEPASGAEAGSTAEPASQNSDQTDPAADQKPTADENGNDNTPADPGNGSDPGQPKNGGDQKPGTENSAQSDTDRNTGNQEGDQPSEEAGSATSENERSPASDDEALQELISQLRRNDGLNDFNDPPAEQEPQNSTAGSNSGRERNSAANQNTDPARPDSDNSTGENNDPTQNAQNPPATEQSGGEPPASTNPEDNTGGMPARPEPETSDSGKADSAAEQNPAEPAGQQRDPKQSPAAQQQSPDRNSTAPSEEQQQQPEPGAATEQGTDNSQAMPESGVSNQQQPEAQNSPSDDDGKMADNKSGDGTAGNQQQQNNAPGAQGDASSANSKNSPAETGDSAAGSQSPAQNGSGQGMPAGSADGNSGGEAGSGKSSAGESSGSKSGKQQNNSNGADSSSESQGSAADEAASADTANRSAQDSASQSQQNASGKSEDGANSRNGGKRDANSDPESQADAPSGDQSQGMQKPDSGSGQPSGSSNDSQNQSGAENPEGSAEENAASRSDQPGRQKSDNPPGQQQSEGGQNQSGGQQQSAAQKGGQGQQGGKGGDGQQPGNGGQGPTGKPGASGGVHTGGGQAGSSEMDDSQQDQPEPGKRQPGQNAGGAPRDAENAAEAGDGSAQDGSTPPQQGNPDPQEVDRAARAANLALRRLRQDIDRGQVDRELLDQLGWTEEQLLEFTTRMQQRLQEREENAARQKELSLSQKSFDEMLRSLDLQSSGSTRIGSSERDRDRTDTTLRNSVPPSRYREAFEAYQRSLSGAGSRPKTPR